MYVPARTQAPKRRKTGVLTKLRRALVAINHVEEITIVPNGIGVYEETHTIILGIGARRTTRGITSCQRCVGNIVGIIAHRAIRAAVYRVRLDARTSHCREEKFLQQIVVVRCHQLTLISSGLGERFGETSPARHIGNVFKLVGRERRHEGTAVVFAFLYREIAVYTEFLAQPQLQRGGIEEVEVVALAETTQRCLVKRVRQVVVKLGF